jgi:hypothetical protein
LPLIWQALEQTKENVGPLVQLQTMWRALPANDAAVARQGCEQMRDFVVKIRRHTEKLFPTSESPGFTTNYQPIVIYRNALLAAHRRDFDPTALRVEGEPPVKDFVVTQGPPFGRGEIEELKRNIAAYIKERQEDPDLIVTTGERAKYEAAFARFSNIFPTAFALRERYYRQVREQNRLTHEEAMRAAITSVLVSPDFLFHVSTVAAKTPSPMARPLTAYSLASRLSYFLWSSLPDEELLAHAAAGDLDKPAVLLAQTRRMLKDERARGLATEFGGHWLDFRRFEDHTAVDRTRFPAFTNQLREAMFEEPIRFLTDLLQRDRSVLELLYGKHTFVNGVLARHYGMPVKAEDWFRVDNANEYERGGLLSMAVFLTQNAPGQRTSPVKRGYWVVRRVLGEVIPPPLATVPELPADEAKTDLPLRELLAQYRTPSRAGSRRDPPPEAVPSQPMPAGARAHHLHIRK